MSLMTPGRDNFGGEGVGGWWNSANTESAPIAAVGLFVEYIGGGDRGISLALKYSVKYLLSASCSTCRVKYSGLLFINSSGW